MPQLKYWNGTAWVNAVVGAQGPQGVQGVQGATGATGATGANGVVVYEDDQNIISNQVYS